MLKYSKQDVEILLFKKILKNEIEENFANIIEQVKFSIQELLKVAFEITPQNNSSHPEFQLETAYQTLFTLCVIGYLWHPADSPIKR